MSKLVSKFVRDESGATAIEYGLIAAAMAVAILAGMALLGPAISGVFSTIAGDLGPAPAA
jgi:pilus assembly protein Flp/PilA